MQLSRSCFLIQESFQMCAVISVTHFLIKLCGSTFSVKTPLFTVFLSLPCHVYFTSARVFIIKFCVWRILINVCLRILTAVIKHQNQNQIRNESVYLAYTSGSSLSMRKVMVGNQVRQTPGERDLSRSHEGVMLTGLFTMACSFCCLLHYKT